MPQRASSASSSRSLITHKHIHIYTHTIGLKDKHPEHPNQATHLKLAYLYHTKENPPFTQSACRPSEQHSKSFPAEQVSVVYRACDSSREASKHTPRPCQTPVPCTRETGVGSSNREPSKPLCKHFPCIAIPSIYVSYVMIISAVANNAFFFFQQLLSWSRSRPRLAVGLPVCPSGTDGSVVIPTKTKTKQTN